MHRRPLPPDPELAQPQYANGELGMIPSDAIGPQTRVPSASLNAHRCARSQRANAVSIASASAANVCERAAANTRPGRGHNVRPPPSTSSTWIDSELRATPAV